MEADPLPASNRTWLELKFGKHDEFAMASGPLIVPDWNWNMTKDLIRLLVRANL